MKPKRGTAQEASRTKGGTIMSIEQNKDLALKTWQAFASGDIRTAFANMSDDISWFIPGNIANVSGMREGKSSILEFARQAAKMFPKPLKSEIRNVYAEGDAVILEMINRGKLANGRTYENNYCFVFEIENGKVHRVREYVDTQKVSDLLAD
jgi:uncharacterized protein